MIFIEFESIILCVCRQNAVLMALKCTAAHFAVFQGELMSTLIAHISANSHLKEEHLQDIVTTFVANVDKEGTSKARLEKLLAKKETWLDLIMRKDKSVSFKILLHQNFNYIL